MTLSSKIRHGRHCVFALHVHLVFVTKYRYRVLDGDALERLRAMFSKVYVDFESELVELDGGDSLVHLLVNYPPKHSISASSRMLRWERPDLVRRYWKGVLWSPSYFAASCGGAPSGVLREYIEQQKTPL